MNSSLSGKVALVTGAGRDVGKAIALELAAQDAAVAVNYQSSADAAEQVVAEIRAAGGNAISCKADIATFSETKGMVDRIVSELGGIDIVVNNAGVAQRARFLETTPEQWKRHIDVGLLGTVNTSQAALPHMLAAGKGGRIISLGGDSSRIGEANLSMAAASRAATIALIKSLAREFGRYDVTCNAVTLGMIQSAHSDPAWLAENLPKMVKNYPLKRIGQPADVAPMVAFLASSDAAWITGQTISINGGFAML
ncbi:MAG: SDR family oxidoreductase [Chelatococcus sp.]|jgi:NAD(P)-dependent dehydrogenase (short-subunit alcohol dehydrogenase family)|uniref:SDR family NAD(P)-dependent oxidoreductase n=1 Tax=unclassified Chelatococcus TaxID=2638111 RepID=UPI001BCF0A4B|nr:MULTISPECIES: SDR family oxidoreductase [unclassified Chelatococcus]CAH1653177.1 3-oxoacyl-(acyl-carrier-protein) reductase FabG [Hyphomicrobiales bacterium]MBS7742935.1 SDR family oxidoreductase [Chelatococcus sp. HY11]MBX3538925.1 SDR family oxidoreductase [Chelatococcus sp.]MBX3541947.1 SDR family oxidoreductase [Chelatococcus sp.]MCO5074162.1 SDR family oxidoreductase [Chelatococcus sp.]